MLEFRRIQYYPITCIVTEMALVWIMLYTTLKNAWIWRIQYYLITCIITEKALIWIYHIKEFEELFIITEKARVWSMLYTLKIAWIWRNLYYHRKPSSLDYITYVKDCLNLKNSLLPQKNLERGVCYIF